MRAVCLCAIAPPPIALHALALFTFDFVRPVGLGAVLLDPTSPAAFDMALYTCKCLNIRLRVEGESLQRASTADYEQRDPFFREELLHCGAGALDTEVTQSTLTSRRRAGPWAVHGCLACGVRTHATRADRPDALINKATQASNEGIAKLKSSPNFSPVFKLLVPEMLSDEKENAHANKIPIVPSLNKQLSASLQSQLECIEEAVRLFRDQKYAEYEDFRERAHRDHKILASIVNKASTEEERRRSATRAGDNAPPSPSLPPPQRRRLSSFKDIHKLKHTTVKNTRITGSEEDSLDAEDVFDLEYDGTSNNGNNSDANDYDSDESDSPATPSRGRPVPQSVARSMPVRVPSNVHSSRYHDPEDEQEPEDIAASIKALARSVHAGVFGDLPRPRFSTQI